MPNEATRSSNSNKTKRRAPPCTLVIFGAGGDLTKRLLMPALYNLSADGLLDDEMQIIGVNHGERETDEWRDDLTQSLRKFAADKASTFHTSKLNEDAWNRSMRGASRRRSPVRDAWCLRDRRARTGDG